MYLSDVPEKAIPSHFIILAPCPGDNGIRRQLINAMNRGKVFLAIITYYYAA